MLASHDENDLKSVLSDTGSIISITNRETIKCCCFNIEPCCRLWFHRNAIGVRFSEEYYKRVYCGCLDCCSGCFIIYPYNCCFKNNVECLCCCCTCIFEKK